MDYQRRHDHDLGLRERTCRARDRARVETCPPFLLRRPPGEEVVVRARVHRIAGRRLHDAGHVLDREDPRPRGRHRVGLSEVSSHGQPQFVRFVEQRAQQRRRDLRVDLEVIHAGDCVEVDGAPRLIPCRDTGRVGIRGGDAIDHRARHEHARAEDRPQVHLVLECDDRIGLTVQIAHRRDAPGDVTTRRPALDVRVGVDQSGNHRFAHQIDAFGAARNRDLVDARDRFDVAVANDDDGIRLRVAARAVDQGRAFERDDLIFRRQDLAATGNHQRDDEKSRAHPPVSPVSAVHYLGSEEV